MCLPALLEQRVVGMRVGSRIWRCLCLHWRLLPFVSMVAEWEACVALILLTGVVSVGSRVVSHHDGVCGKADMFVLVELFNRPVESGAQTVGGIASKLGETNYCCAMFVVCIINSHTFLIVVIGFGQAGPFVFC